MPANASEMTASFNSRSFLCQAWLRDENTERESVSASSFARDVRKGIKIFQNVTRRFGRDKSANRGAEPSRRAGRCAVSGDRSPVSGDEYPAARRRPPMRGDVSHARPRDDPMPGGRHIGRARPAPVRRSPNPAAPRKRSEDGKRIRRRPLDGDFRRPALLRRHTQSSERAQHRQQVRERRGSVGDIL